MIICFDIGGSAIKGAIAFSSSNIQTIGRKPTPLHDFSAFVETLQSFIQTIETSADTPVSIATTGVVDENGRIIVANIPCLNGRIISQDLGAALGRRVTIVNDADAFALAESYEGAGKKHKNVFGVILGTGVGGGIVIDGKLLTGPGGFAGEWGHGTACPTTIFGGTVQIPQLECGCGQVGCLDTLGAARGLERLHKHFTNIDKPSIDIITDWEAGEQSSTATVEAFIEILTGPLAMLVNVLAPSIIPVGGGLSNSERLVSALDVALRGKILRNTQAPLIVQAECKIEPGIVGAAIAALNI